MHPFYISFLHFLDESLPTPEEYIKNSFELVKEISEINITTKHSLISLDVISLFTNIPIDLALDCINDEWNHISKKCMISKAEFLKGVRFILDSTYFTFDKIIYKQKYGAPMGSPLSPIIADLVMQRLEKETLMLFRNDILFYYRYVDDLCMAVTSSKIDSLHNAFNAFHPRLQFTLEIGGSSLNFLDVSIIVRDDHLIFDWYQKSTFSGRFLNYFSNHSVDQKRGIIYGLLDKALLLSDSEYHEKNIIFIINILIDNDYPLNSIFDTINYRIKNNYRTPTKKDVEDKTGEAVKPSWLTVPYVASTSEKFKNFNHNDVRVSFYSPNKLNKYIKVHKDRLEASSKSNVVYKINCRDCDASYVGQTGRKLKTRMTEHRNHIRWNTSSKSVITDHKLQSDHEFDWDNICILDEESCYKKRLISEMLHIKKQKKSLNLQTDTEGLHAAYIPIINNV